MEVKDKMSLGGRPKEEDGHKPTNVSLNVKTLKGLKKISEGTRSRFIEKVLDPHLRQLDPGESCQVLDQIDKTLRSEIITALSRRDFEKAATLSTMGNSLSEFRVLCRLPANGSANEK